MGAIYYQRYPYKAKIPDSNRILISLPHNADRLFSSILSSNSKEISSTASLLFKDDYDYIFNDYSVVDSDNQLKCHVSLLQDRNARSALARAIVIINKRESLMEFPSTWNYYSNSINDTSPVYPPSFEPLFFETPFDFSSNYIVGGITIHASYNNIFITLRFSRFDSGPSNQSLLQPIFYQSLLQPIFNQIVKLFHGHKTVKDIKKVDWLELKPEIEKNDKGKTGTTFKLVCKFRDKDREMRDRHWILAVCEEGELSVEKAEFKALSREFRDKINSSVDPNVVNFFKDAREIPDTVYLALPEGKKTAELTFYFISEDGTQYSSQRITLTVPEAEKESTSTK